MKNHPRSPCRFRLPRMRFAAPILVALLALALRAEDPPVLPKMETLQRAPDAEQAQILAAFDTAQKQFTSFHARFIQTKRWKVLADETKSEGSLAFVPPGHFRFETTAPHPALTVSDGQKLWLYYPEFKEAEEYSLNGDKSLGEMATAINVAMGFQAQQLTKHYDATVFVGDAIYIFELVPREAKMRRLFAKMRIWFNRDFLAQQSEILSANGDSTLMRFTEPKKNEPIAPAQFVFTPPPGVEVSRPLEKSDKK